MIRPGFLPVIQVRYFLVMIILERSSLIEYKKI